MAAPRDLGPRGRRLWRSIAARDPRAVEVGEPRRDIAHEACRAADRLDLLAEVLVAEGLMVVNPVTGGPMQHPALPASERNQALMARLIVALRLPDVVTGQKPQRHGMRGVQTTTRAGGKVSALDRARAAAAG